MKDVALWAMLFSLSAWCAHAEDALSDKSLQHAIQAQLARTGFLDPTTSYSAAFVDLNGDGRKEAIVYIRGDGWCGSGGCKAMVLTPQKGGYRVVMSTTITQLPLRILDTRHHGWRDIGVEVSGGGVVAGEVALSFDGHRYPTNPTMPPARRVINAQGTTVIETHSPFQPLYR